MILVVGGAGYIGSHMLLLLRQQGLDHLVFDNLENGHAPALQGSPFFKGDLRDPADLDRVFREHEIDVVMHFAAYASVGESVREPHKYFDNNTVGVLKLLEAMRKANVTKLVFSSTAAIFGEPDYVPIDEDHPKDPTNPYGDSKLSVERILKAYDKAYGVRSVCLRYFNAAGADPDGVIGEDHHPEEHLIPVALLAALGKREKLTLFGGDYPTEDGFAVRDYIHVMDLADAHLMAIEHLRSNGDSRHYNLGNGKGFSVKEVVDTVEKVIGREVPKETGPRRAGDPARLIASSDRIRKDWGWTPKFPDLETIVRHAWQWRESHPDGY